MYNKLPYYNVTLKYPNKVSHLLRRWACCKVKVTVKIFLKGYS